MLDIILTILIIIAFPVVSILIMCLIIALSIRSHFIEVCEIADKSWTNLTVPLTQRTELVPRLVDEFKFYAGSDYELLERISHARTRILEGLESDTPDILEIAQAHNDLTSGVENIITVGEGYPGLQRSEDFKQVREEFAEIDERVVFLHHRYNGDAGHVNTKIDSIPDVVLSKLGRFSKPEYFDMPRYPRVAPAAWVPEQDSNKRYLIARPKSFTYAHEEQD